MTRIEEIKEKFIHLRSYGPRPRRYPLTTSISIPDLKDLSAALDDARPVMELLSKESCKYCDDVTMACAHVQARAWMKEYFPEVKT